MMENADLQKLVYKSPTSEPHVTQFSLSKRLLTRGIALNAGSGIPGASGCRGLGHWCFFILFMLLLLELKLMEPAFVVFQLVRDPGNQIPTVPLVEVPANLVRGRMHEVHEVDDRCLNIASIACDVCPWLLLCPRPLQGLR